MAANVHPGTHEPIDLPGTTPVSEIPPRLGEKQVTPYGDMTLVMRRDAAMWPGYITPGVDHHVDERNGVSITPSSSYRNVDVDVAVGGRPGATNRLPYTLGVVRTEGVENHDLNGRQVRIRRQPENQWGPVSGGRPPGQDFSGALAQQGLPDLPDWVAQSGIAEVF